MELGAASARKFIPRAVFQFTICWLALWVLPATAQSTGSWSSLRNLPYIPVHMTMLPSGKVLLFSYYTDSLHPQIWDPASGTTTAAAPAPYELFCAGHNLMADGRVFITGGHVADYTGFAHALIYDPVANTFTRVPDMNAGRWYPTNLELPNGDILVVSGDINSNTSPDPLPQVYQVSSNSWRNLTTAQLQMPLYPVMLVAPDGRVFNAGPARQSRYLNTSGTGSWSLGPSMVFGGSRDYGPGIFYEAGKILEVGGSDPPTATAEVIDLTAATPGWKSAGSMHYARRQHNAVVLPDGKVLVVGGSSGSGFDNSSTPVYPTEMWDPATGQWTVMASISAYRGYHSTAFLLPDGTVFSGGGNVGGPNYQIFTPPYLSAGPRPTISSAPTVAGYGQTIFIGTPDAANITKVSLVRLPAVTHTFAQSQGFQTLKFTQATGGLNVSTPANANLATPGDYMLFIMNGSGVPSVAAMIHIASGAAPTTGTITGLVTTTSGTGLAGATVSGGGVKTTTFTDGSYTLSNVPPGTVTITAALNGYSGASESVTVTAGSSVKAAPLVLAASSTGSITGHVVSSTGAGIPGATVSAAGVSTTTDSTGTYTLNNIPTGTQNVTASATNYSSASTTVVVAASTTVTAPNITLSSSVGSVTGKVTNTSGAAIVGASVGFGGGTATTDSTGAYTLNNLPTGTIQLVASAAGYSSQTQNVTVVAGTTVAANFTLAAAATTGSVSGKVTNISNGVALSGATVSWSGGTTTTNSSGIYTLNGVAAGTQSISAVANGYLKRTLTVSVPSGGTATLNLSLATAGKITAVVKNSSGAAISGARITINGGVIATTVTGTTNTSGTFATSWIPVGSYTITASESGHTTQTKSASVTAGATTTVTFTSF